MRITTFFVRFNIRDSSWEKHVNLNTTVSARFHASPTLKGAFQSGTGILYEGQVVIFSGGSLGYL
ncbi:hypothetical protein [Desulfosporosinus sp. OT]|uniref:hypothetical protein n=1 Tax=Desulfosporosinus sp. OT TaxID=913865 RepID=UPI001300C825|nr:hypothetical protein [Desulfosporosinus sp. OT]